MCPAPRTLHNLSLIQCFSAREGLAPRGHLAMSGDTFDGHNCNRGEWAEARDTAQHPAKPGAAPTQPARPECQC